MKHYKHYKIVIAAVLVVAMLIPSFSALGAPIAPDATYRMYLVANSHIDTAWRWPIQHTAEEIIRDTFTRQINALKSDPGYRFTQSCSTHYIWTKEYYPSMYEDILDLYDKGQWGIAGGQFVEPDLNVMEGETFVRQGLYAQHFFLEEFGSIAKVGLVPDVFGFSGQFPQFLRKTGMTAYVATKLNWSSDPGDGALDPGPWSQSSNGSSSSGRESDIFWWEAVDGTDVLAYACAQDYTANYGTGYFQGTSATSFTRISRSGTFTNGATLSVSAGGSNVTVNNPAQYQGAFNYDYDSNIKYALGMFGQGDHGGGPQIGTGSGTHGWPAANNVDNSAGRATVLAATLDDYFRDVRIAGVGTSGRTGAADGANRDATLLTADGTSLGRVYRHVGENYLSYHRGTYTSWSRVKKDNRQLNNLSQMAEQAATLGFWTKSLENNSNEKIELSWERISVNTMHDILPGSSGPIQYYQTFMNNELCRNLLTNVQNNALSALAYRANTNVDTGVPVFVYNPMSWERENSAEATVTLDKVYDYVRVYSGADEVPATVLSKNADGTMKISFIAKAVPSLGYKVFKVVGSDTPSTLATDVRIVSNDASAIVIENDNLRFTINKATGNIPSLINKKDGNRESFYPGAAFEGNALQWKTDTGGGSYPAWDMTNSEFGGLSQNWNTVNNLVSEPEIVFNSPERVTVKVVHSWTDAASYGPSTATRYITLFAGSSTVDVAFDLDFQMQQRNLKVAFPVNVDARAASYEIAYGAMDGAKEVVRMDAPVPENSATNPLMANSLSGVPSYAGALGRATIRTTRWNIARFEQSGHKWMDVTADSKSNGFSILDDAKYGYDVLKMVRSGSNATGIGTDANIAEGDTYVRTRMTVVRSPQSANNDYQRPNQVPNPTSHRIDIGQQDFNYAIYPHAGTWQDGNTSLRAHELNFPLQAFQTAQGAGDGILGSAKSFLSLNKDNVVVGAVKNQHDEQTNKNKLIVRVWETNGADTTGVVMTLPSTVKAVREVNMLEHDYNELSKDNIDAPISKELKAKTIAMAGNTVTFNIDHYEILTMEIVIEDYEGAAVELRQEKIDLSGAFNLRGTTPDGGDWGQVQEVAGENRRSANLDGNGNTIPEPLWKAARLAGVDYSGIGFQLGPDAAPNFITADGQAIAIGKTGYNKVYLLGLSGSIGAPGGEFIVNYSDGSSTAKQIAFADWRSPLTGWVPMDRMDSRPYVYDSVAHVFTHWHAPTEDMMTFDNYLYVYYIDVDAAKTIASITLPRAAAVKIAGITVTNSAIPGFGATNEDFGAQDISEDYYWDFSDLSVSNNFGSNTDKLNIGGVLEPAGITPFAAFVSGPGGQSGEEARNILVNDGSTKWCYTSFSSTSAPFVMDAGEPVRKSGYVIRGANDDMSNTGRVLHSWRIEGSNSTSGPWFVVANHQTTTANFWTSNFQTSGFDFTYPPETPEEGFRYYRLTITRRANTAAGTAIGTGATTMQFSFWGFFDGYRENGNLTASVSASGGISKAGDDIVIKTLNGPNVVSLSGTVASLNGPAPLDAMSYSSILSGLVVKVQYDTKLSFLVKPENADSTSMAIDAVFADGSRLRNTLHYYDAEGSAVAIGNSGNLVPGEWNYVEVDLGAYAYGRIVNQILIGYEDDGANPGATIDSSFDSIRIFRGDTPGPEFVTVWAALFDADDRLVSAGTSASLEFNGVNTVGLVDPIVLDASEAGSGYYVKAFFWTTDDFLPVVEPSIVYQD